MSIRAVVTEHEPRELSNHQQYGHGHALKSLQQYNQRSQIYITEIFRTLSYCRPFNISIHRYFRRAKPAACFCKFRKQSHKMFHPSPSYQHEPQKLQRRHLSISLESECVVFLPRLSPSGSCFVITVSLAQTTRLLASCGETTRFAVLVHWVDNPVDAGVAADCFVLRIYQDYLEVLVCGVLIDPVRVQDTQIGAATTDTLFSG